MSCANENFVVVQHDRCLTKRGYVAPRLECLTSATSFFMQPTSSPLIKPADTGFDFTILEWKAPKF